VFKEERNYNSFSWKDLGDIKQGRPNLGPKVPVLIYRLFQYTLRDRLIAALGVNKANEILVQAGKLAGSQFCQNLLDRGLEFDAFVSQLQQTLKDQGIGVLRIETADLKSLTFTLVVAEDLDCSGLPFSDEVICQYDEGFIAGIFEAYTGKPFFAKEVDCWASGGRVCRFDVREARED
jgi:predicted hydrocarbon binding protein